MRILVTGGAGFVGSHLCEHLLKNTGATVTTVDRLDTSGNPERIRHLKGMRFIYWDLRSPISKQVEEWIGPVDWILHLAAATHVDRSINDPMSFVMDNVVATVNVLDFARKSGSKVIYFSTDEVFGPAPVGMFYKENDRYNSGNPYAASKAGAEEMAVAYANTYKLPVIITHCMNVFGERQHPEKFVPMTVKKILAGEKILVHSDPTRTIPGSRFYIHARNVASAILFLMKEGHFGEKYNIVGEKEVDNLEMVKLISSFVGKDYQAELVDFHSSRPGHDLRYALDGTKLSNLGWKLPVAFEESLARTVRWTLNNKEWLCG